MSLLTVTLTIGNGPLVGEDYELRDAAEYVLGRGAECCLQLPDELPYKDISRRHCLLRIELPHVRLLDLGSTNGTFVNGAKIGGSVAPDDPEVATTDYPVLTGWHPVQDGDVIALGTTILFVRVQVWGRGLGRAGVRARK